MNDIKKQTYISSLYDISLSIGTSLDLDELLDNALSSYIRHIDCSGGMIVKTQNNDFKILVIKPKILKKQATFIEFIFHIINSGSFDSYIIVPCPDNQYCYISKLSDFGYLVLIKSSDFSNEYFLRSLEPLNQKLSNSIITCINSQKLRENEQAMFQQNKLASMGEMMANVAHQWRQPLNAISMSASGIELHQQLGLLDDEEMHKSVQIILRQVDYLSKTIETFRNFFKPNKKSSTFKLLDSFENILTIIKGEIVKFNIEIILNINEDIYLTTFEQELMHSAINIINNAKDVLIEKNISHKLIKIDAKKQDDEIIITFQDNGGGIKEEIIGKIFEPYFTTKHQSQGTGIGLFMTSEIICKHLNGTISASNKEFMHNDILCTGAEFTIKLKEKNEYN